MTATIVLDAGAQAIWTRPRAGGTHLAGLVRANDRGSPYTSIRSEGTACRCGHRSLVGSVVSASTNGLAAPINGSAKTELIKPRKPWRTVDDVELATAE
jgi:putative transposase